MEIQKEDKSKKDGIAAKPLASLFEVWLAKREANGKRIYRNEGDKQTMVYLANKRAEGVRPNVAKLIEKVVTENAPTFEALADK